MDLSMAIGMLLDQPRSMPVSTFGTVRSILGIDHGFCRFGTLSAIAAGTLHALQGNSIKTSWHIVRYTRRWT